MPLRESYALSPDELKRKLDSDIASQGKRYRGVFEPIQRVAARIFAKRPKALKPEEVNPELVRSVASSLEASLVMAEDAAPDGELNIIVRNLDLSHFVAYMRGLDSMARDLAQRNGELVHRLESLNGRHEQAKDSEKIKADRAADDDCFSGEAIAREARLLGSVVDCRKRSGDDKGDVPMAEKSTQAVTYPVGSAQLKFRGNRK